MITDSDWKKYEPLVRRVAASWAKRSKVLSFDGYAQAARYGILKAILAGGGESGKEGYYVTAANNAVRDAVASEALVLTKSQNKRIKGMWAAIKATMPFASEDDGTKEETSSERHRHYAADEVEVVERLNARPGGVVEDRDMLDKIIHRSGVDATVALAIFVSLVDDVDDEVVALDLQIPVRRVRWYRTKVRAAASSLR